ncbi:glycosyltransferase involved in cell wall biosynthesis [Mobilisporobacter senegalensis]|uniref:Glycosyltransferase involved in cell wall biosynthesis n=1 Tax=Mobilisporobacter senegalensis TaxID=1329262 RepID=A0A3N1XZ44_9FIRM|nr:glycosyltransferase family 2 protein [Mobilisporobacter senegalensis]ROR31863.1 glycosyltransferase involved in cell wall biosynthesis [Mobilisporobacter senegalensis]
MKLLTVAIPCYNSAAYMSHAIETILTGGEDVEILIINDGSKDDTAKIADEYANKYPTIIRAIHQENGGHGEAVNAGLRNATGLYYKVVDSDDWVNEESLKEVLGVLHKMVESGTNLDLLVANYVYEKVGARRKKVMNYRSALPRNKVFGWADVKFFKTSQYILMHSVVYRTKLLRDCGLILPKHTFYVDNIFVYQPLPQVKTLYYLDTNFYRYFIGREDQSVNESVMISRIDQQIRVTKIMIDSKNVLQIKNRKLKNYMIKYLSIMMTVSSVLLIKSGTAENLEKKRELWRYLKEQNPRLYRKIRSNLLGQSMNLPGESGRKMSILGYKISRKIYGFN